MAITVPLLLVSIPGMALSPSPSVCGEQDPHPPIRITEDQGNQGFTWTNPESGETEYRPGSGVTRGNGTPEQPYVIENWCVFVPQTVAGIHVSGTQSHVLIQNNHVSSTGVITSSPGTLEDPTGLGSTGVQVEDATNVEIADNAVRNHESGITLESARQSVVRDNGVERNAFGVALADTGGENRVLANELHDNHQALLLRNASHTRIAGNDAFFSRDTGFRLADGSEGNVLADNSIVLSEEAGLRLSESSDNRILDNDILLNSDDNPETSPGVEVLSSSEDNTFRGNAIAFNDGHGVAIMASDGNEFVQNPILQNERVGVDLQDTDGTVLRENEIRENSLEGLRLSRSDVTEIEFNEIEENGQGTAPGVSIEQSTDVQLSQNNVTGQSVGLEVKETEDAVLATGNWWGDASGPGGTVQDACSGTMADGEGSSIVVEDAKVCFDPWRTEPVHSAGIPR